MKFVVYRLIYFCLCCVVSDGLALGAVHTLVLDNDGTMWVDGIKIFGQIEMNRKKYSLAIFCDLSKAFDMVPIDSLLIKLEKIGIRGRNLKWFENYLRGRTKFVRVRNNDSSYENMYCGIPQGSILGPILFLIFFVFGQIISNSF